MGIRGSSSFVVLALAAAACQAASVPTPVGEAPRPPELITNGEDAASCQWPATVALRDSEPRPYCSATLIHPRFVLTAAHCITIGGMPATIGFGEDGFEAERSVGVVDCELHPEFETGVDVDLAVCELEAAVTDVQPVPVLMGCEADVLQPEAEVMIAGFGNTQTTFLNGVYWEGFGIGPKRFVSQQIFELREAEEEVDFLGIDAMSGGCHGDSGGGAYVQLADGSWRVFAVAQSLWNVPGFETGTSSGEGTSDTGGSAGEATSLGGGFVDPTTTEPGSGFIDPTGVAFIDPSSGGAPMEVCGYGTTYSLVTPRMDWVEGMIGEDVTPCFDTSGSWDPNDACTPFPLQIDQAVGTWAEGCAGELGGEPQCGELPSGTGTSTGPAESSSGPGPDPDTGTPTSTSSDETTSTTNATSSPTSPTTSGAETSDTDGETPAAGDEGCGCRHEAAPRPGALALVLLALLGVRRRRIALR